MRRFVDHVLCWGVAIVVVAATEASTLGLVLFFVFVFAGAAQEILGTARWGKSVGKALLGIRVVDAHGGRPPDLLHAWLRWWIPGLLPPLVVWASWDAQRQGIHDKAAETLVVVG